MSADREDQTSIRPVYNKLREDITFPDGTQVEWVKKSYCEKECSFAKSCSKPFNLNGVVIARNIGDTLRADHVVKMAKCNPRIEGEVEADL